MLQIDFMQELGMELENIGELREPDQAVGEGDHAVGEAPPIVRKLYTVATAMEEAKVRMALDARYTRDEVERQSLYDRVAEVDSKEAIIRALFWLILNQLYPETWRKPLGLRRGWIVVWLDPPTNMLGRIFGLPL